jgi:hypothetical protein
VRLLAILALVGCSSGTGTLALSWQFIDGRSCADSGASTMSVRVDDGQATSFACAAGASPASVMLAAVPRDGATLSVEANSPQGTPLYSGTLGLDALPSAATVELYADRMR